MMPCPFCAEQVPDDATLCRHCKSNFAPLKPLEMRVEDLEQQLSDALALVSRLEADLATARSTVDTRAHERRETWTQTSLASLVSALSGLAFVWALPRVWEQSPNRERAAVVLWFAPLAVGFWLGAKLPGIRASTYVLSGSAFGLMFTLVSVVLAVLNRAASPWDETEDVLTILFILASSTLLGVVGGLIGDGVERMSRRLRLWAELRAESDPLRVKSKQSTSRRTRYIEVTAALISAVQPLLTFVAALFTAYLMYLGAREAARPRASASAREVSSSGALAKPTP
jgi:hypothetical protein